MKRIFIFFYGPPGSGKGTQAKLLKEHLEQTMDPDACDILTLDMGNALRTHGKKIEDPDHSILTEVIDGTLKNGTLLPPAIPAYHWVRSLGKAKAKKDFIMILDGVCRTYEEVPLLVELMVACKIQPMQFVLEASEETCIERMSKRGRPDDNKDTIANRLSAYFQQTIYVSQVLERKIKKSIPGAKKKVSIDANQSPEAIAENIASFF